MPDSTTILVSKVKVGDVLSINTGYRPLDDENCEVLDIRESTGMFGDPCRDFFIKSYEGNHWHSVNIFGENGKGVFEYHMTKGTSQP